MPERKQPGPEARAPEAHGDWEKLMGKALQKHKPAGGWPAPKPPKKKKKPKKSL
jgi:hypothetical protein